MPLLSGLFGSPPAGPVPIPVQAAVPIAFRVYYQPRYPPLLEADLRARAAGWLEELVAEPLRSALRPLLESDALSYTDMEKTAFPPPLEVLRGSAVGDEERHRLESAYQVTVVACRDAVRVPMPGLWTAIAAARSAALELGGALFDAAAGRIAPVASYRDAIAGRGVIRAADHVELFSLADQRGLARWSTRGMGKFGLPELEVQEAPAELAGVGTLLGVLAQHLVDAVLTANHASPEPITRLDLGPEISLAMPAGPAPVRIFLSGSGAGGEPVIDLLPPAGFPGGQALFLARAAGGSGEPG